MRVEELTILWRSSEWEKWGRKSMQKWWKCDRAWV